MSIQRLVLALCAISLSPAVRAAEVTFAVPEGWTDLGPNAKAEGLRGVPEKVLELRKKGRYAAMAVDLSRSFRGYSANMNATIHDGRSRSFGQDELAKIAAGLEKALKPKFPNTRIRSQEMLDVAGARCGRLLFESEQDGNTITFLQYYMPAPGRRQVILTFAAHQEDFESKRPLFESMAARTGGLEQARTPEAWAERAGRISVWVIGGAVIAVLIVLDQRRRRRAKAPGTPGTAS